MIQSFPKLQHLRTLRPALIRGPVEVTEKVDGSQFGFMVDKDGNLLMRSKTMQVHAHVHDSMWSNIVSYLTGNVHRIPVNIRFWGEYLRRKRHNKLEYKRLPRNHIALYGAQDVETGEYLAHGQLSLCAMFMGFDVVPMLYHGEIESLEQIEQLLDNESFLGGPQIEGVVVKRFVTEEGSEVPTRLDGWKLVSAAFAEVKPQKRPVGGHGPAQWQAFCESFAAVPRWEKAVQHLRDRGELAGAPRDIGALVARVQQDVLEEEKDFILSQLWGLFHKDVTKACVNGLAPWYLDQLYSKKEEA